jgi:hypothetical protein
MTAMTTKDRTCEITITLPEFAGSDGCVPDHDLTLVLPWYYEHLSSGELRTILGGAFPESNARSENSFGDALRSILGLPSGTPSYPAWAERDAGGRAGFVSEAIRRLHRHCVEQCPPDSNPKRELRRFLHPGAKPVRSVE